MFLGATNQPLSLVHNEEFREFINEADPRYLIPHRQKLQLEIEQLSHELRLKLLDSIQHGRKLSFCADVWSKPGMSASFLGVTCHYFSHYDMQCHQVTLAVHRLPSPHTAPSNLSIGNRGVENSTYQNI